MKAQRVQAKDALGNVVFDKTVDRKTKRHDTIIEAINVISKSGGTIRAQTVGAKAWAVYQVAPGSHVAEIVHGHEWSMS